MNPFKRKKKATPPPSATPTTARSRTGAADDVALGYAFGVATTADYGNTGASDCSSPSSGGGSYDTGSSGGGCDSSF